MESSLHNSGFTITSITVKEREGEGRKDGGRGRQRGREGDTSHLDTDLEYKQDFPESQALVSDHDQRE